MEIDDAVITRELERIRVRHRLDSVLFVPQPPAADVDEDLTTVGQVEALFHPSGLLIRYGQPVLAYIRDHTFLDVNLDRVNLDPKKCRRVHFTVCAALKSMKTQGRFERYRITNRQTNRYLVDVRYGWRRTEEREAQLYPCQYCLGNVKYQGFRYEMPGNEKRYILNNFDAEELFGLLRTRLTQFREQNSRLRRATRQAKLAVLPSGYPRNWKEISEGIRQRRNYTCEKCGVRLSGHASLLDVHHLDGDKQNVQDSNLRCLCKLCHHDEHPHYQVKEADRVLIEALRRRKIPLREKVDESWVPPDPPHWTPPASWWEEKGRRASLLIFYLCRPGGIAWSDAVSKAKKYNDEYQLRSFPDREWRRQNRAHARSWVKTSRKKDDIPEFKSVGDDERGELVLKSGQQLSQKELVALINRHKNWRG